MGLINPYHPTPVLWWHSTELLHCTSGVTQQQGPPSSWNLSINDFFVFLKPDDRWSWESARGWARFVCEKTSFCSSSLPVERSASPGGGECGHCASLKLSVLLDSPKGSPVRPKLLPHARVSKAIPGWEITFATACQRWLSQPEFFWGCLPWHDPCAPPSNTANVLKSEAWILIFNMLNFHSLLLNQQQSCSTKQMCNFAVNFVVHSGLCFPVDLPFDIFYPINSSLSELCFLVNKTFLLEMSNMFSIVFIPAFLVKSPEVY